MPPRSNAFLLPCVILFLAPAAVAAQKLEAGQWTGTVTPPNGQALQVTFDVAANGDSTTITMNAGPMGAQPLADIKILADRITFTFTPGPVVSCTLMLRKDKSYQGDCLDPDGGKGVILMTPPKKE
jgi:hypothetical protein